MSQTRQIKATGKDGDGDITSVKGAFGEDSVADAIKNIESGKASYSVGRSDVHVFNGPSGKYLRTEPDGKAKKNLDNLPDA